MKEEEACIIIIIIIMGDAGRLFMKMMEVGTKDGDERTVGSMEK